MNTTKTYTLSAKAVTFPTVFLYALLIHAFMLIFDWLHPDVFLLGDRSIIRLYTLEGLINVMDKPDILANYISGHGIVGDYFFQGIIYKVIGQYGLIVFQLLLNFAAIYALFRLTFFLTRSNLVAFVSAILFIHLPHFLVFPHMLVSEAFFNPLLILSFWTLSLYVMKPERLRIIVLSGMLLGIATLIRPITALWPFIVIGALLITNRFSAKHLIPCSIYTFAAVAPLILWMCFIFSQTGHFSMGESNHDAKHNLFNRVDRINRSLPASEQQSVYNDYLSKDPLQGNILSLSEYLRFGSEYPVHFAKYLSKDLISFSFKSGINRLTLDYFSYKNKSREAIQNPKSGYRHIWDTQGFIAALKFVLARAPLITIITLTGSVIYALFFMFALKGAVHIWIRKKLLRTEQNVLLILIGLFPIYVFTVSQIVDAMQSRHRSPAEFAICIFAAFGIFSLSRLKRFQKFAW